MSVLFGVPIEPAKVWPFGFNSGVCYRPLDVLIGQAPYNTRPLDQPQCQAAYWAQDAKPDHPDLITSDTGYFVPSIQAFLCIIQWKIEIQRHNIFHFKAF